MLRDEQEQVVRDAIAAIEAEYAAGRDLRSRGEPTGAAPGRKETRLRELGVWRTRGIDLLHELELRRLNQREDFHPLLGSLLVVVGVSRGRLQGVVAQQGLDGACIDTETAEQGSDNRHAD